ncbi:putative membrane protein YeiB [Kineococcus xinjiangensis]|uniref:Putative membrane protein YeiB n=1 Tax=Kineococcus xinjiangensis TaxID=512762 RepID=A0A2S6IT97_9ACTN|nr:putative membrane protein YeiB [Kineococcus xinjiangensis]
MPAAPVPAARAVPLSQRSLAPDVARGAMLLLIALANAHIYLVGRAVTPTAYPVAEAGSALDRWVAFAQTLLVDGRAYPMFSLLFGYGLVQLARRRQQAGGDPASVRGLVRRRGGWMILIGALHGILLWSGDIIGAYGLVAVLFAGVLVGHRRGRAVLVVVGVLLLAGFAFLRGLFHLETTAMMPSLGQESAGWAALLRLVEWTSGTLLTPLLITAAVALGAWAASRGLLDEPARHLPLLRWVAVAGLALAVVGGLPLALVSAGTWQAEAGWQLGLAMTAHSVSGYAGAFGYAAVFGLLAARAAGSPGPVLRGLAVGGQWSMSSYLAQSVVFCAVLAAWGGGLGTWVGTAAASGIALLTWAGLLVAANVLAGSGRRGPAEALLRRLTYGRASGAQVSVNSASVERPSGRSA